MAIQRKVCLWGAAPILELAIGMCRDMQIEVLAILDNNAAKWGKTFSGVEAMAPERLKDLAPDYVLVLSVAGDAIARQAAGLGFPPERVVHFQANHLAAMQRVCPSDALIYYDYSFDGEKLCTRNGRYTIREKISRDVPAVRPIEEQREIVARVLDAYLRAQKDAREVPPIYRVGENWGGVFDSSRQEFYQAAQNRDIDWLTQALANFCRNDLGASIIGGKPYYDAFVGYTAPELWLQKNMNVWKALVPDDASLAEAAMPPIGNPYGYNVEGHLLNWNSLVNNGRAHRCVDLLEETPRPVVAEIGGGFGGFAYQLLRQNHPLVYLNFDLPENLIISSYYLSMAYPEKRILLYDSPAMPLDSSVLESYDAILMPNFMLPKMADCSVDYFINTISFSEMEHPTICEYFAQIDRIGRQYFYHENLSCRPSYKGYPVAVFPALRNFKKLHVSFVPWSDFDGTCIGHSYLEHLYQRRGAAGQG